MRHHNANRKFGREQGPRRALLRSLAVGLIERGRITTTATKAKELRPYIEKMVTRLAKQPGLASQRLILARLGGSATVSLLAKEIAPRYAKRPGGYTRIIKLPPRGEDASPMAMIEFV